MIKKYSIDNTEIACWVNPSDFGAHERSLVFVHSSGSNLTSWSYQYSKLHKQFNIVAIDLPGHGQSGGSGENEVDNYCLWVKQLLDILRLKNPVLIGQSLGAAISLKFALHYPEALKGIVPVGAGIKMPVNPLLQEGLKSNPAEAIALMCKFSLAKENRPKLFEALRKSLSESNLETFCSDLTACNCMDLTNVIGKIHIPVCLICGAEDKMTPPDFSRRIAASISGARLVLVEGAGHTVMLEKPDEFNKALCEFASAIS
jgi:pimeloyl-ACP methyl ester carboxylesterase